MSGENGDVAQGPSGTQVVTGLFNLPLSNATPAEGSLLRFSGGQWVNAGRLLMFTVTDDDGTVGAAASVTRIAAAVGVLAGDRVIGVSYNSVAVGSGLNVVGSVPAADQLQLTYNNGTSGGVTNGPTKYTFFVWRG